MSEMTPNKVRKLAAVVESWKLHPGPETLLQNQAAAALNEYAAVLEEGLSTQAHIDALREREFVVMGEDDDGERFEVTWSVPLDPLGRVSVSGSEGTTP